MLTACFCTLNENLAVGFSILAELRRCIEDAPRRVDGAFVTGDAGVAGTARRKVLRGIDGSEIASIQESKGTTSSSPFKIRDSIFRTISIV